MLTTRGNPFKIESNNSDVVVVGAAIGPSGPAGQLTEERGDQRSDSEVGLSFKEPERAGRTEFFLRGVLCFEDTVSVEDAAIARPKRTFEGRIRSVFGDAEQEAI